MSLSEPTSQGQARRPVQKGGTSALLRVGLLGCGRIAGYFHAPILGAMNGVEVVAIADGSPQARDFVGARVPGAVRFADWQTLIETAPLDAVVICLPPALHAPAAIAAFERGLHVYVEKPLAVDRDEADAMIATNRASGKLGMVGLNFRYNPLFNAMRERRLAGDLGDILAVRTLFTSARRKLPGWKGDPRAGGGAIADLATHHFDLVPWLVGSPVAENTVSASERRMQDGSMAAVHGALEDGTLFEILIAQTTGTSAHSVELLGSKGHLSADVTDAAPRKVQTPPGRLARAARIVERAKLLSPRELLHVPGRELSFAAALTAFVDGIRSGTNPGPDLEAGRTALQLALLAERGEVFGEADTALQAAQ